MGVRDLEKMVSFQGIGAPQTEDDMPDDLDEEGGAETWATDKPTEERTPRKKGLRSILHKSRTDSEGTLVSSLPIQSLVISDDDIEDDW
jgi:cell cycle checkpoint protein